MRKTDALLSQKTLFNKHLNLQSHQLSAFHFSSVFLWQDFFDFEFEVIKDSLCVYAHQKGASFLYLPPLSTKWDPSIVERCFLKMNKINTKTARIENVEGEQVDDLDGKFKSYAKANEYVYQKDDLIQLKGHAYKSQRHDIHHFQMHHQGLFRPFEEGDLKACMDLYERWAKARHDKHEDEVYRSMLMENRIVHELAIVYRKELDLVGCVVEIDQKIAAYSFGYSLNSQTFCVLLEITDVEVVGLSSFIFNRVCSQDILKEHSLINTMDDFGLPYVAASKQAYHPKWKPVSYTVTFKDSL
ncbi:MAG: phosphatidylglycerol lysyltransferase domain-containing protein [Candidatus Omnitrophota bacterium]